MTSRWDTPDVGNAVAGGLGLALSYTIGTMLGVPLLNMVDISVHHFTATVIVASPVLIAAHNESSDVLEDRTVAVYAADIAGAYGGCVLGLYLLNMLAN